MGRCVGVALIFLLLCTSSGRGSQTYGLDELVQMALEEDAVVEQYDSYRHKAQPILKFEAEPLQWVNGYRLPPKARFGLEMQLPIPAQLQADIRTALDSGTLNWSGSAGLDFRYSTDSRERSRESFLHLQLQERQNKVAVSTAKLFFSIRQMQEEIAGLQDLLVGLNEQLQHLPADAYSERFPLRELINTGEQTLGSLSIEANRKVRQIQSLTGLQHSELVLVGDYHFQPFQGDPIGAVVEHALLVDPILAQLQQEVLVTRDAYEAMAAPWSASIQGGVYWDSQNYPQTNWGVGVELATALGPGQQLQLIEAKKGVHEVEGMVHSRRHYIEDQVHYLFESIALQEKLISGLEASFTEHQAYAEHVRVLYQDGLARELDLLQAEYGQKRAKMLLRHGQEEHFLLLLELSQWGGSPLSIIAQLF